jgi:hypothetical protein
MQKAGTRWLYQQMEARVDVWMPPIKEINFFIRKCFAEDNLRKLEQHMESPQLMKHTAAMLKRRHFYRHFSTYQESRSSVEWYRKLFDQKGTLVSGDISPNYSELGSDEIRLIAKQLPRTKFILLVREPVDRAWSALCMSLRRGKVSEADITDWDTLLPLLESSKRKMKSLPSELWKRWSAEVSDNRMGYWFFEDICARPQQVIDEVCGFLGVKPGPGALPADFNSKKGNDKIEMPPHIRMKLTEYYRAEIEACARAFGGHANGWREQIPGY